MLCVEHEIVFILLTVVHRKGASWEPGLLSAVVALEVDGREPEVTVMSKGFCINTASDLEDCKRFSQYKVPKGCAKEDAKLFVIKYLGLLESLDVDIVFVNIGDDGSGARPAV